MYSVRLQPLRRALLMATAMLVTAMLAMVTATVTIMVMPMLATVTAKVMVLLRLRPYLQKGTRAYHWMSLQRHQPWLPLPTRARSSAWSRQYLW